MNTFCRQLVPLLLLGLFYCISVMDADSKGSSVTGPFLQEYGDKKKLSEWKAVVLQVENMNGGHEHVHAKESAYEVPLDMDVSIGVRVTAFITKSGQVWIGPSQEFYVETESGIIGGYDWVGEILWCETLVAGSRTQKSDLGGIIQRFENEITASRLAQAHNNCDGRYEDRIKRLTDLRGQLNEHFFGPDGSHFKITNAEVTGATLRLDLRSSDGLSGSAWIDINTKKLLRIKQETVAERPAINLVMTPDGILVIDEGGDSCFGLTYKIWCYLAVANIVALLFARWVRRRKEEIVSPNHQ